MDGPGEGRKVWTGLWLGCGSNVGYFSYLFLCVYLFECFVWFLSIYSFGVFCVCVVY